MPVLEPVTHLSLKNILFPTDFSEASFVAAPFAQAWMEMYGAKLWVTHLLAPEPRGQIVLDPLPSENDRAWEEAEGRLASFAHDPSLDGTSCHTLLERGDVAAVIPDMIQEHAIDLVVVGTHGRRGVSKLVHGSQAEKIYRSAPCPVLTVGPFVRPTAQPRKIERILFPVDLKENPEPALGYAMSLADERRASLMLLHADPLVPWQYRSSVEQVIMRELAGLVPKGTLSSSEPHSMIRWEYPAEAILSTAEERGIDLIVMGVHKGRLGSLSAHLPWPVASEVVSRAPCPVLTLRV